MEIKIYYDLIYAGTFLETVYSQGMLKDSENNEVFRLVEEEITAHYPTDPAVQQPSSKRLRANADNILSVANLQPIENAGGFQIHLLGNEIHFPALQLALEYTKGNFTLRDIPEPKPIVSKITLQHPLQMFKEVHRNQIKAYQRLFQVKKADTDMSRLIGHPQMLNEAFVPERFQLVSFLQVPELLRDFTPSFYAVELDLKNYFPQIPIQHGLSQYLGVIMGNKHYVQTVLTQGWSGSTFVAQALTYAFVALCTVRYKNLPNITELLSNGLPSHILLPGFLLIIVYDNILIVTDSPKSTNDWATAIQETAQHLNLVIKYMRVTHNRTQYLGQEYKMTDGKTYWRTLPSRLQKWTNPQESVTLREALGYISIVIRENQIRSRSLKNVSHVVKWLASLSLLTSSDNWRNLIVTEQFDAIVRPSLLLLDDSWTHISMFVPVNPLFIATDATPSTLAWYTRVGGKDTVFSCSTEGHSHINFLEALAVYVAIEANYVNHDAIFILCDNQAASLAYVKGYSSNGEITRLVQESKSGDVPIIMFDVESEGNIADFPSRNKEIPENHSTRKKWDSFVEAASILKITHSKWMHRSTW